MNYLAIFIGGGVGSVLRYAVQALMRGHMPDMAFPWATLSVNVAGSFLIGLFYSLSARFDLPAEIRLLLTAGLCGGFTTFSTFSYDNIELLRRGQWLACLVYVVTSVLLGAAACMFGASLRKPV